MQKLYNIPCTGLRFFTVYGPAGKPVRFCGYIATGTDSGKGASGRL